MPYEVQWLVEGRVILAELIGDLSPDEMPAFNQLMHQYLDQSDATKVHYIVDTTRIGKMTGLNPMRTFTFPKHPRMGWTVGVGISNPAIRMIGHVASYFFRMRAKEANTVEEGLAFLQRMDSTLLAACPPQPRG